MHPVAFRKCCEAVWGDGWPDNLATAIGAKRQTARRFAFGDRVPNFAVEALLLAAIDRITVAPVLDAGRK